MGLKRFLLFIFIILSCSIQAQDSLYKKLDLKNGFPEEIDAYRGKIPSGKYSYSYVSLGGAEPNVIILIHIGLDNSYNYQICLKEKGIGLNLKNRKDEFLKGNTLAVLEVRDKGRFEVALKRKENEFYYKINYLKPEESGNEESGNISGIQFELGAGYCEKQIISSVYGSNNISESAKNGFEHTTFTVAYTLQIKTGSRTYLELRPGITISNYTILGAGAGLYFRGMITSSFFMGGGIDLYLAANTGVSSNGKSTSMGGTFISPQIIFGYKFDETLSLLASPFITPGDKVVYDATTRHLNNGTTTTREIVKPLWGIKLGLELDF